MTIQTIIRIPAFNGSPAPDRRYDALSYGGALMLAERIERMWRLLGYRVRTWVEPIPGMAKVGSLSGGPTYAVRSDMINGMPR